MKHTTVFKKLIVEQPAWLAREISQQGQEALRYFLNQLPAADLAPMLECLSPSLLLKAAKGADCTPLFRVLSLRKSAELLRVCNKLEDSEMARILLSANSDSDQRRIEKLAHFPEASVGAAMDPAPLTAMAEQSVDEVLLQMRKDKIRNNRYIHVIDESGVLKGVLSFKDAYYADEHRLLSSLLGSKLVTLRAESSLFSIRNKKEWKFWSSLPVTDASGVLLGVLRHEEIFAINAQESATENRGYSWAAEEAVQMLEQGLKALPETFGAVK